MSNKELVDKVAVLPKNLQEEVSDYIDFLINKQGNAPARSPMRFGMMKGTFKISGDFDEPLIDFKDYMP